MILKTAKRYNSSQAKLLNFKKNADTATPNKIKLYHFPSNIVYPFQYYLGNSTSKEKRVIRVIYPALSQRYN